MQFISDFVIFFFIILNTIFTNMNPNIAPSNIVVVAYLPTYTPFFINIFCGFTKYIVAIAAPPKAKDTK